MPRRLVNNLLQLKFKGAGYEVTRFLLNTTIGIGGVLDIAKEAEVPRSDEDTVRPSASMVWARAPT